MTKREMFAEIRKVVIDNAEMVAFIDKQIELLDNRKASPKRPTAKQLENEGFKADIIASLIEVDKPVTIKELCDACPSIAGLSNQRITHLLMALQSEGKVVRTLVKKTPFFAIAQAE